MEHQLSAFYDITHGLGLAILTPRWMEYCLDETNVSKYVQFAVNVFGVDASQEPMAIAKEGIQRLYNFFFKTLGLQSTLTELGIGKEHFAEMAYKACGGNVLKGFKTLTQEDVIKIYEMCL